MATEVRSLASGQVQEQVWGVCNPALEEMWAQLWEQMVVWALTQSYGHGFQDSVERETGQ